MTRSTGALITVVLVLLQSTPLRAAVLTSTRARTIARFKRECEDGKGKSCYNYGRALWSMPGAIDRKSARKYLLRGCELKYREACEAYEAHSQQSTGGTERSMHSESTHGTCFTEKELSTARFSTHSVPTSSIHGLRIDQIRTPSFWIRVGLKENDVIFNVNNMPFDNQPEVLQVFARAGKKFAFQVERNGDIITLWYSCD